MFVVHLKINGPGRFTPLGHPDGTNDNFVASASGTAAPTDTVSGCLTRADAVVVIWHSDGKTHGKTPGTLGVTWHHSVIASLPLRSGDPLRLGGGPPSQLSRRS